MKLFVLGDRDTVMLFALAGIDGKEVTDEETAISEIKRIRREGDYGLVLVTEQVSVWADEIIRKIRFSKSTLLITEIPDKNGHIETGKSLADYIREAVGIRI